jgi:fatty-acyl-CoA synthase
VGTKQVHPGPYLDPPSLLDLYVKERVTVSAGVPTIWIGIQQSIEREPDRWDYVKPMRMIVGGSAAPESMIRTMDTLGMEVIHAWGMTETAPLGTVATVKGSLMSASEDVRYAVRAKQGYPVPFFDVRAVNSDGEVAWDGVSMGELQVRGPWVASSYYANPDAEDRWTADGWFCTGDVVTIDAHGYVQITDRTKDLIKSGGEWISSIELENTLMGHPSVLEAAVIAVPHPKWVERPLAVVVPRPGQTIDAQALEAFLAQKFNKIWLPDGYVVRDAIPRTSAGKILKSQLRDELQNYHNT